MPDKGFVWHARVFGQASCSRGRGGGPALATTEPCRSIRMTQDVLGLAYRR